jgi:hypothetical protein
MRLQAVNQIYHELPVFTLRGSRGEPLKQDAEDGLARFGLSLSGVVERLKGRSPKSVSRGG